MVVTCKVCEHSMYFKEYGNWFCNARGKDLTDLNIAEDCGNFEPCDDLFDDIKILE